MPAELPEEREMKRMRRKLNKDRTIGDNSDQFVDDVDEIVSDAGNQISRLKLRSFIQRIERLEGEKAAIADDIRDVYQEAKSLGFDVKTLRFTIKERKLTEQERQERDSLRDTYIAALGEFFHTPLGQAAAPKAGG